jgi:hypothetical protein
MKSEKMLNWYQSEIEKDKVDLDREKLDFIKSIKNRSKEEVLPPKPKKLNLWQRLVKILIG